MKNKAPTKEATGALDVYNLLQIAAGGIPTGDAESGPDHIGFDLASSGAAPTSPHRILKDTVDPQGRSLGWIGYERREEFKDQLCISVWFYSSQKGKTRVRKRLGNLKPETVGKLVVEENAVGFLYPAADVPDHEEWIGKVLQIVAQNAA